jgi:hypothetical protein
MKQRGRFERACQTAGCDHKPFAGGALLVSNAIDTDHGPDLSSRCCVETNGGRGRLCRRSFHNGRALPQSVELNGRPDHLRRQLVEASDAFVNFLDRSILDDCPQHNNALVVVQDRPMNLASISI